MVYAGCGLSGERVDVAVCDGGGVVVAVTAAPPDADGLRSLVERLRPLACKTDTIEAGVFAELCRRDLVPAIWLPDPWVRAERERTRFRLHLVRHGSRSTTGSTRC